jgi:putative cell wall-binding protein
MSVKKTTAFIMLVALLLVFLPVQAFAATSDSDRLAGNDRIATAIEIADAGWSSASTVIIAAAEQANLVDSLAAASLAGQEDAPILLTFKNSLSTTVKAKVQSLGAQRIYVVGAVSDTVVSQLRSISGVTVEKLAGGDRWATADAINARLSGVQGTFVVGYNATPDALSVASYAAANHYQILLADTNGRVSDSKLIGTVYIIGGRTLVADITGATRFGGTDRYDTNARVIQGLNYDFERSYVANGLTMADALAASSLAAHYKAPIFLSNGTSVPAISNSGVKGKISSDTKIIALGGTGAIPAACINNFKSAISGNTGVPPELTTVTRVDAVAGTADIQKSNQVLQVKVNSTAYTVAQIESAGYDVEFSATDAVFDGKTTSSDGKLDVNDLKSLFNSTSSFEYKVAVYERSTFIAESDYETINLIDGNVTASGGIGSYQLNLHSSSGEGYEAENIISKTAIVGETLELIKVKATTASGGTNSDVTASVILESSENWVAEVEDDNDKLIYARAAGTSTITIRSGSVTTSFKLTVKEEGADNNRVPYRATADKGTVKVSRDGGTDYVTLTMKDQYGDPYGGERVYYNTGSADIGSGSYTVGSNVATVSVDEPTTPEGKVVLSIEGDTKGTATLNFRGEKYYGEDSTRNIGSISVNCGSSTSVSKVEVVAADSKSAALTLDRNNFADKKELKLYAIGYTSDGYATGSVTINDVTTSSSNLLKVTSTSNPITVEVAEENSNGDPVYNTGSGNINVKVDVNGTTKTISKGITVTNSAPSVTGVRFVSGVTRVDGNFNISEILEIRNVTTSGTLGDGTLYLRNGSSATGAFGEFYFTDNSGEEQVVGFLRCSNSNVTYSGDTEGGGSFSVDTSGISSGATISFSVVKVGNSTSVGSLSVKVD